MRFTESKLPGVFLVDLEPFADERGFFARTYCSEEFATRGLSMELRQCSVSFNARRGTLRGLHLQAAPHEEHKLVRVTAGSIFDVIVDVRPSSATYRHWVSVELNAQNRRAVFIPAGFAHGFMTLSDDAEVFYMISAPHSRPHARGFRWNDPAFGVEWPMLPSVISERDAAYPLVGPAAR
jgi:dTDP-4-dehydrorhamnose 3,5-epimerase